MNSRVLSIKENYVHKSLSLSGPDWAGAWVIDSCISLIGMQFSILSESGCGFCI